MHVRVPVVVTGVLCNRAQESDLHLDIYSSLNSASNLNLLTILALSLTSSSIVVVFIAKAAHVWVS